MATAATAVHAAVPYTFTQEQRSAARKRHFRQNGKNLHQSSSPAIPVAVGELQLQQQRWDAHLRTQQRELEQENSAFISSLFTTESTFDAAIDIIHHQEVVASAYLGY